MTTKRKHNEVTLKTKYKALEEFDKKNLTKKLPFSSTFLEVHFLAGMMKMKMKNPMNKLHTPE